MFWEAEESFQKNYLEAEDIGEHEDREELERFGFKAYLPNRRVRALEAANWRLASKT